MNVPVKVIATRIDRSRGNVCTSRRAVLEKDKNAEVKEMLKNIKEGDIVNNAKVKATTDWGVFLDINGLDALLHVSDLSHGRVKKPSELVTIGQNIKVKITKIDKSTNRISASIKALTEDPYENISKKYKIGEVYEGTCTKLMDYGAFVKLEEGVEGLIHNSELSWESKNVNPSKILSVSEKIKVKIVSIEQENKRISLSYKATLENPWNDVKKQIGSIIDVKIKNVTEKGIFATLENGLTGMVFYRDVSYNDQEQDLSKFKKNESIKVKVIDVKDEKIKLSIKALDKDPMDYLKDNNKKVGDIITTRIHSVMANGVKVSIDPDKKLIATIKKAELAKDSSDARPEVFSKGNALDAKIMDLNYDKKKNSFKCKSCSN